MKLNAGYLLIVFLFFCGISHLHAQENNVDPKELFNDAEFFFSIEEYEEALYYYLQLVDRFPDHANFNYKVGLTYLEIPGQEYLAIPYFKKAIQSTTLKYRRRRYKQRKAHHAAYFYLGKAYRYNNELDKALEYYDIFVNSDEFEGNFNIGMVEDEIAACERGKIIRDVPVDVEFTRLPSPVNDDADNTNAILSGDGKTMIYVSALTFYDAIFLSRYINGAWSEPDLLNPQVGSDGDLYPTSLSYDGKELYMVKRSDGNDDIFFSVWQDPFWSKAQLLNENINTRDNETHASITSDGRELFFTSDRRGGYGGLDIYRSERTASGEWGPPVNLGPQINSAANEETPFLTDNHKRLYFSSENHYTMGGYDIFFSDLDAQGNWRDPVNIGFPINTTGDNLFYYPIGDGRQGYLARIVREGPHTYSIYHIDIKEKTQDVSIAGPPEQLTDDFEFYLIHPATGDTLMIRYSREENLFKTDDPAYKIIRKDE